MTGINVNFRMPFNEKQAEAISMRKERASVVLAGPGTGKTKILEGVVKALVSEDGASPDSVLLLTFTRSGAENMRARVLPGVHIHTFHSFALWVMKQEKETFRKRLDPITDFDSYDPASDDLLEKIEGLRFLLDDFGSLVAVKEAYEETYPTLDELRTADRNRWLKDLRREIGRVRVSHGGDVSGYVDALVSRLSAERAELVEKQVAKVTKTRQEEIARIDRKIARNREMAKVYEAYVSKLRASKKLDFDDVLAVLAEELSENAELLGKLRGRFKHVLVDEYQDTNPAQERILRLLSPEGCLFMVGDEKQSIFSFQGAEPRNITSKADTLPNVRLEDNYRSTQAILDASSAAISEFAKDEGSSFYTFEGAPILRANAGHSETPIEIRSFRDEASEDAYVADRIAESVRNGTPADEIAVIYRNNAHGGGIAAMLAERGIPFKASLKNRTHEDDGLSAVVDLVAHAFLRGHVPESVRYRAMRLLSEDPDSVDRFFMETADLASSASKTAASARSEAKGPVAELYAFVSGRNPEYATYRSVPALVEEISGRIPETLPEETKEDLRKHLATVRKFAARYGSEEPSKVGWKLKLARELGYDFGAVEKTGWAEDEKKVSLLTAHASKGLEFDEVFVLRGTERAWRKGKKPEMFAEAEDLSYEDANLFYVAMTRAKKRLVVTSAPTGPRDSLVSFVSCPPVFSKALAVQESGEGKPLPLEKSDGLSETVDARCAEYLRKTWTKGKGMDFTKFSLFHKDRKAFYEKYVLGIMDDSTPATAYGNMVHEAVETEADSPGASVSPEWREAVFERHASRENPKDPTGPRLRLFDENSESDLRMKWESFVSKPLRELEIRGIHESECVADVDGMKLYAKIDSVEPLFERDEDGRTLAGIRDYKSGRVKSLREVLDESSEFAPWRWMASQLAYYAIVLEAGAVKMRKDGNPVGDGKGFNVVQAAFTFFDNDKGTVENVEVPPEDVGTLKEIVLADLVAMKAFAETK